MSIGCAVDDAKSLIFTPLISSPSRSTGGLDPIFSFACQALGVGMRHSLVCPEVSPPLQYGRTQPHYRFAAGIRDRTANKDCQTLPENCQTLEKDQALQLQNTNHFKGKIWCPEADSNHRHADFQSAALPTELSGRRCLSLSASALLWQLLGAVQRKSAKNHASSSGGSAGSPGMR